MELLKKLVFAVFLVSSFILQAQDYQAIIDAFSKSYEYEKKGDYANAISVLKNVYDEKSYEINLRLGWLNYSSGKFSESIAYYNKAINLKPYSIEAKMGLIYPLSALGKTDQMIKVYNEILKIDPNYYPALYYLGYIYYSQGRYAEALPLFQKLVDMFPFDHDALLMFAWTNYQLKKYQQAKILFNKVLMNNPNDESAKQGLSLVK